MRRREDAVPHPGLFRQLLLIRSLLSRQQRRAATVLIVLMIVGTALETIGIGLVIPAIGLLTQPQEVVNDPRLSSLVGRLGEPDRVELMTFGMLALVIVFFAKTVFLSFVAWRQNKIAFGIQAEVSERLFGIYLRQPYVFHLQRNSAELVRNVIQEVWQFNGMVTSALNLISESLIIVGIGTLLLVIEPAGAAIVVVVLGAAGWTVHRATRARISRWGTLRQAYEGMRFKNLQEGLGGAKEVKLGARELHFLERFSLSNRGGARVGALQTTLQQLPRLYLDLLAVAGIATLALTMLATGRNPGVIVPTLGLFAVAAFRLLPSANRVLSAVQALRFGVPVVNMLRAEVSLPAYYPDARHRRILGFADSIHVNDVSYTYPFAPRPAVNGLSVTISKGEAVGFFGPSGSGKSTLVDLILGLLTPQTGRITVDGNDIQRNLTEWQRQLGYVPQTIFLMDDTLRRNVAFGIAEDQIDEEAVLRSITAAQLDKFVSELPLGLETLVGERGVRLSGGQRQRIGVARALYHAPAVLVLDEATSALDQMTEHDVMTSIMTMRGDLTIVAVAHRLSTLERCDRVYRVESGCLTAVFDASPSATGAAGFLPSAQQ